MFSWPMKKELMHFILANGRGYSLWRLCAMFLVLSSNNHGLLCILFVSLLLPGLLSPEHFENVISLLSFSFFFFKVFPPFSPFFQICFFLFYFSKPLHHHFCLPFLFLYPPKFLLFFFVLFLFLFNIHFFFVLRVF